MSVYASRSTPKLSGKPAAKSRPPDRKLSNHRALPPDPDVVVGCAGVYMEEKDMEEFCLLGAERLSELMRLSFHNPAKGLPACFLSDFIDVNMKYRELALFVIKL
ncbi:alpha/beta-Hydrolases superfamily protein, partial [Striga asiatica]